MKKSRFNIFNLLLSLCVLTVMVSLQCLPWAGSSFLQPTKAYGEDRLTTLLATNSDFDVIGLLNVNAQNMLQENLGVISGQVTDEKGAPMGNAIVYIQPYSGGGIINVKTDMNGNYITPQLNDGEYRLYAQVPGMVRQYYQDSITQEKATLVQVTAADGVFGVDFRLRPGGSIAGKITDREGHPLAGARLTANLDETGNSVFGTTDGKGNYKIEGLTSGKYRITATTADKKYTQIYGDLVKIKAPSDVTGIDFILGEETATVPVQGVALDKTQLVLTVSDTPTTLTATLTPTNASDKNLEWTSSNPAVAAVTSNGLTATITPQKAGETTITVTTRDGGKTAACKVTVKPVDGGDYQQWQPKKKEVAPGKLWTVKFSKPVDAKGYRNHITVKDAKGQEVNISLALSLDGERVLVYAPSGDYSVGRYTLFVERALLSVAGEPLKEAVKMEFIVE